MKKLLTCILFVSLAVSASSQLKALVELNRKSALSIFVETNMMNFCLVQKGDCLLHTPVTLSANMQKNGIVLDDNVLDLEVKDFKTDNHVAEYEFYKLMKVDRFPRMKIELVRFELGSEKKSGTVCGTVFLNITITNVTRQYAFPVNIGKVDDLVRVEGKKKFSITDFGLSAPRNLLLGMVKINEQIVVGLDFLFKLRTKENSEWSMLEINR